MAMMETALKAKIIEVMTEIRNETDNPDASMQKFAEKLATAIISEVRKMTITAIAPNGPVTVVKIE